jgi:hypothetical protein
MWNQQFGTMVQDSRGIISFGRRPLPGLKLYIALRFWYYVYLSV